VGRSTVRFEESSKDWKGTVPAGKGGIRLQNRRTVLGGHRRGFGEKSRDSEVRAGNKIVADFFRDGGRFYVT